MYQTHPAFNDSTDPNTSIWRYCDLGKLISLLSSKSLYFALAAVLNDPYEGALPRLGVEMLPREIRSQVPERSAHVRNTHFVNCWHMNDYESAAMWQLYSRLEEGIAIRSTFARLRSCFQQAHEDVYIGTIKYIDYRREKFNVGNLFESVLHKQKSFEHEHELRAIHTLPSNVETGDKRSNGPRFLGIPIVCDPDILIELIYVSPLAPKYFRDAVVTVCDRLGLKKEVIQSDLAAKPLY